MISVIICSVKPHLLKQVTESIEHTIGVPFEILFLDNRISRKGICQVYNELALQAKFEYVLFLHEDVVFAKKGWGEAVCKLFEESKELGVIGIAGSNHFSPFFTGWYTGESEMDFFSVTHRTNGKEYQLQSSTQTKEVNEVICIDGVFIMCRKNIWEQLKFNESLLKGFHFYDIDFSIRASKLCRIVVHLNIPLVHITLGGDYGDNWVKECILFHKEFKFEPMPENVKNASTSTELKIANRWLDLLKYQKISFKNRARWIFCQRLYLYPSLYFGILKFMFYRYTRIGWLHRKLSGKYN
jgi:hypothetical protein